MNIRTYSIASWEFARVTGSLFASGPKHDIGRLLLGIGIMLLSLKLIVGASMPMRESEIVQLMFSSLGDDLILAVIVAAVAAWLAHSGLATVLLIISLAGSGVLEPDVAFAFVLGANIGSAIPAVVATPVRVHAQADS